MYPDPISDECLRRFGQRMETVLFHARARHQPGSPCRVAVRKHRLRGAQQRDEWERLARPA